MTAAPLPPGLRPGGAADVETGLEHPLFTTPAAQSQAFVRSRPSWRDQIKVHPAADLFPRPSATEGDALADDINKNGLLHGVVLWTPEKRHARKAPDELFLLDGISRLDAIERAFSDDPEASEAAIYAALYVDQGLGGEQIGISDERSVWIAAPQLLYGTRVDGAERLVPDIDPYTYVVSANLHRRHLTRETKRELIEALLKAQPEKSDRQIAATAKASPSTVGAVRAEVEEAGTVSNLDTRIGADGVAQPAHKPARPKPPPISRSGAAFYAEHTAPPPPPDLDELKSVLAMLRGDPGRIANLSLEKRVGLARVCLAFLNLTVANLRDGAL
jgi:hypothetical protein